VKTVEKLIVWFAAAGVLFGLFALVNQKDPEPEPQGIDFVRGQYAEPVDVAAVGLRIREAKTCPDLLQAIGLAFRERDKAIEQNDAASLEGVNLALRLAGRQVRDMNCTN
jgi:hypothetical protein